jgi:FdrA protein
VITKAIVRKNQYQDSVRLMTTSRQVASLPGIAKALILLGTDSNKKIFSDLGLLGDTVAAATPNDLVICLEAASEADWEAGLAEMDALLAQAAKPDAAKRAFTSLEEAADSLPGANFALFSIPGRFAKLDVVAALEKGLNVMLFSDNVSLSDEIELKKLAVKKDLLLMGPDCGTAIIGGVALCFANAVRRGSVGIVGASGTGIQEISCLIDRLGGGVSHAIGVGGRDLKKDVGGLMTLTAIKKLARDPDTKTLVLVSKPGDPAVTAAVLSAAKASGLAVVACLLGDHGGDGKTQPGVIRAATLDEAALAAVPGAHLTPMPLEALSRRAGALAPGRRFLRGLYSGGTLGHEALLILGDKLAVQSNIAHDPALRLEYPAEGRAHSLVDLGEDAFTDGRAHPMIDSGLRCERLARELADPDVAVVLLDVVLGYGASADPAGDLARVIAQARDAGHGQNGPLIIAHVCGTAGDPQGLAAQEAKLAELGALLFPTNAQAARAALHALTARQS